FQAEDGIRDFHVTGVQTCALPIWTDRDSKLLFLSGKPGADGTSGIFLYPGMYIDDNKEQQASLSFSGTYPLWGQQHEASFGYIRSEERRVGKGCRYRRAA